MSHESVIASLKKLIKQDLISVAPQDHAHHVMNESDRASIILCASVVEDMLVHRLQVLMPSINSDERDRLFNFEGPCGSFSNRIRMAQALSIIDRPTRKQIDIIKEMRNVAAHSHAPVDFGTPEIKEAAAALFPPNARQEIVNWQPRRVRAGFSSLVLGIANALAAGKVVDVEAFWEWLRHQKLQRKALPGTRSGASPRNRRKGKRGK
jgi:hypothetical protein